MLSTDCFLEKNNMKQTSRLCNLWEWYNLNIFIFPQFEQIQEPSLVVRELWSLIWASALNHQQQPVCCTCPGKWFWLHHKNISSCQLVPFKVQLLSTLSNTSATLHWWERVHEYSSMCLKTISGLQTPLNIQRKLNWDAWTKMDATTCLMWLSLHFFCASVNVSRSHKSREWIY